MNYIRDMWLNNRNNKFGFNKDEDNIERNTIDLAKQTLKIVELFSYNDELLEISETMKAQKRCWKRKHPE